MKKATLGYGSGHAKGYSMFPKQVVNHDNVGPVEYTVLEAAWLDNQVRVTTNVHRPARTQTVMEKMGSGRINTRLHDGFALLGGE